MHGIELRFSGVESHNYIGVGERYHIPHRRVLSIARDRYPSLRPELTLKYAVKALNDTMGTECTIPSFLVFGTLPTLPAGGNENPGQDERMEVMMTARGEMQRITAELRVKAALESRLPPETRFDFKPGKRVRVYREAIRRWEGPFQITRMQDKIIWVTDGKKIQSFNCVQILPDPENVADRELSRILKGFQRFNTGGIPGVYVTEIIHPRSEKTDDPDFCLPKAREMCGLFDKGAFEVVCREQVPDEANIMGGRFELAVKNTETERPTY